MCVSVSECVRVCVCVRERVFECVYVCGRGRWTETNSKAIAMARFLLGSTWVGG